MPARGKRGEVTWWVGLDVSARYGWRCGVEGCLRELRKQKDKGDRKDKRLMFSGGSGRLCRLWYALVASKTAARHRSSLE